ncbi:amidase family protein [Arvimicrobium flavum]|uniref:amidase family protein n=1 Tax=Arvimicrobium flavum TaxID=3393320 RepID=UPI00237B2E3C|nr:amidase family protein [Mesorhizobium shangrilense]
MSIDRDPFNAFLGVPEVIVSNSQSGPLAGLTLAVKDIFDVAGLKTGWGNPQRFAEAQPALSSAPAVQALLDAGARFAGKTQTEELAFSMLGQNVHFPHPINPAAPGRVTGGSSSGSAAAVAGGLVDIATGSDTGGSVRAPASFCGLIGLRTTHGAIPLEGTMPLAPSFDTFGWFAKDIDTYESVGEVLLGAGSPSPSRGGSVGTADRGGVVAAARDAKSAPPSEATPSAASGGISPSRAEKSPLTRPLRIAALDALLMGPDETAEYRRLAAIAADVLGPARDAAPPPQSIDELYWCMRKLQAREAWEAHGDWIGRPGRQMGEATRARFLFGKTVTDQEVAEETTRREAFTRWLADLLSDDGVLVLPTAPCVAPPSDGSAEVFSNFREQAIRLLCWSGLSGFPQISLPLGSVHGAPFGLSLLGPAGSDMTLIRLGRRILKHAGKA